MTSRHQERGLQQGKKIEETFFFYYPLLSSFLPVTAESFQLITYKESLPCQGSKKKEKKERWKERMTSVKGKKHFQTRFRPGMLARLLRERDGANDGMSVLVTVMLVMRMVMVQVVMVIETMAVRMLVRPCLGKKHELLCFFRGFWFLSLLALFSFSFFFYPLLLAFLSRNNKNFVDYSVIHRILTQSILIPFIRLIIQKTFDQQLQID